METSTQSPFGRWLQCANSFQASLKLASVTTIRSNARRSSSINIIIVILGQSDGERRIASIFSSIGTHYGLRVWRTSTARVSHSSTQFVAVRPAARRFDGLATPLRPGPREVYMRTERSSRLSSTLGGGGGHATAVRWLYQSSAFCSRTRRQATREPTALPADEPNRDRSFSAGRVAQHDFAADLVSLARLRCRVDHQPEGPDFDLGKTCQRQTSGSEHGNASMLIFQAAVLVCCVTGRLTPHPPALPTHDDDDVRRAQSERARATKDRMLVSRWCSARRLVSKPPRKRIEVDEVQDEEKETHGARNI